MRRALITAGIGLLLATCLGADSQSSAGLRHQVKSEQGSATPEVRITPTSMGPGGSSIEIGSDRWIVRGYDLKGLISEIYETEDKRIDLPENVNGETRYDVSLVLHRDMDADQMEQMLKDAVAKKFNIRITPETRAMEVYVMSAPSGPGSALHHHAGDGGGQITYAGRDCPGISSHGIVVTGTGLTEFGRTLEDDLNSVVVDETKLPGSWDFKLPSYSNPDELLKLLQNQLGLVVKPLERNVTVLKVRPQGEFASL